MFKYSLQKYKKGPISLIKNLIQNLTHTLLMTIKFKIKSAVAAKTGLTFKAEEITTILVTIEHT